MGTLEFENEVSSGKKHRASDVRVFYSCQATLPAFLFFSKENCLYDKQNLCKENIIDKVWGS